MGNPLSCFLKPRNYGTVLPEDLILLEILPKLPIKSLLRFKCVSKIWYDHITNHSSEARLCDHHSGIIILAKHFDNKEYKMFLLHKDHDNDDKIPKVSKIELSYLLEKGVRRSNDIDIDIDILGSSKGLVLLSITLRNLHPNLILWNPMTREFRNLPNPTLFMQGVEFDSTLQNSIFDLGFDENNNNHKIVRVSTTSLLLNFQVFSKKSDSWRNLNPLEGYKLWTLNLGVSLNGAFYFLAVEVINNRNRLLSFDFCDEKVQNIINVPNHLRVISLSSWKDQSLAILASNEHQMGIGMFEFWVMINNDHDHDHQKKYYWTSLFKLDNHSYFWVCNRCGIWRDQFLVVQFPGRGTELRLWDPFGEGKRRRDSKLTKLGPLWFFSEVSHSFVPSLVSVY